MVIESQGQLDKVIELVKTKNFFIQVLCDTIKKHPSDDKISVIMLYFDEWYVVPFDHIDCINLSDLPTRTIPCRISLFKYKKILCR